jgi:hypothetical protein
MFSTSSHWIVRNIFLLFVFLCGLAQAEDPESCGDILRYASRDVTSSVNFSDVRKYYYNQVCKNASTGAGLSFGDADLSLGLSYSSKDDYCANEKTFDLSTNYSRQDASIVVGTALSAYVQCRSLSSAGINTYITVPPTANPIVFSVQISRSSANPVTITQVRLSDSSGVSCSTTVRGKIKPLEGLVTDIGYALPQSSARWALSCTRQSTAGTSGTTFNPIQLIVSTTQGDLPVSFSGVGLAANNWASDIKGQISVTQDAVSRLTNDLKTGGATHHLANGGFSTSTETCAPGTYMVAADFQLDSGGPHGITSWIHAVCRSITPP